MTWEQFREAEWEARRAWLQAWADTGINPMAAADAIGMDRGALSRMATKYAVKFQPIPREPAPNKRAASNRAYREREALKRARAPKPVQPKITDLPEEVQRKVATMQRELGLSRVEALRRLVGAQSAEAAR